MKKLLEVIKITFTVICLVLMVLIVSFQIVVVKTHGFSMFPTIKQYSSVFALNIGKQSLFGSFVKLNRGNIITFITEDEYGKKSFTKRIIGLPGDVVEGKDGKILVNGKEFEETYLNKEYIKESIDLVGYFNLDFDPVVVGENEYFVLGDNRGNSKDSRIMGTIHKNQIETLVLFKLYDKNIDNPSKNLVNAKESIEYLKDYGIYK